MKYVCSCSVMPGGNAVSYRCNEEVQKTTTTAQDAEKEEILWKSR